MRLVTYTFRGTTRLGALAGDSEVIDLNRSLAGSLASDGASDAAAQADLLLPPDMLAFLDRGERGFETARRAFEYANQRLAADRDAARGEGLAFDLAEQGFRLEAPIPRPGTVLAIGLNYQAHVDESRPSDQPPPEPPKHPTVFVKVSSCITGPGHPIEIPKASALVDWEGELCVVIGKTAHLVSADRAFEYVAGYTIGNDVSVRDWQFHAPTWVTGKGFDTHGPIGPCLVTTDEAGDVGNLQLRTWVNGELKQDANTRDLIFSIPVLIEYLTTAFTLRPGDIIFTGTPAGVGAAMKPPQWLKAGDSVRVEITGLGTLENPVVDAA